MTNVLFLVFESIGTQELIVIAIGALLLFGPRKLPELGRKLGKALAELRRASEDFKQTWQMEVELEEAQKQSATRATTEQSQTDSSTAPDALPAATQPTTASLAATPAAEIVARGSATSETINDERGMVN